MKCLMGGKVILPDQILEGKAVIYDEKIVDIIDAAEINRYPDAEVIDVDGLYIAPGLIDVHSHGCVGEDATTSDAEGVRKMCRSVAGDGVTSWLPTVMTYPVDSLSQSFEMFRGLMKESTEDRANWKGAEILGVNMEGPYINVNKKGAHVAEFIQLPDVAYVKQYQDVIRLLTIAPEVEGAMPFIQAVYSEVGVSLAHTAADYNTAMEAFGNGARHVTHLFNAMDPYSHRAPGVIGAAADSPGAEVELICDGIHIHPAVVRSSLRLYGPDRVILISDSMEATGMPDGEYSLGGQPVYVKGNRATLADGTIAGSATNLMQCLRVMVQDMGLPLETAVRCAAVNPARSIGIYDRYGSIAPGKVANLVLLNQDLEVMTVILNGEEYIG